MIKDIAEVLRFQDKREPAFEGEEPGKDVTVWSEIKMEDFDPLTNFVLPEGLGRVGLFQPPRKFAIQKYDILMYFNGAKDKLGRSGLVVDDLEAVPGRTVCILRCFRASEALPFFFFLQDERVRAELVETCGKKSTGYKSFLSLEEIKRYPIDVSFIRGFGKAEDKMWKMIEDFRASRKAQKKALDAINEVMYMSAPEGWENWDKD